MFRFACPSCSAALWFDSMRCEACGTEVAYRPESDDFAPVELGCSNRQTDEACNWEADNGGRWCRSCVLDLDHTPTALRQPFQSAKRRCLRQLSAFGVDVFQRQPALRFDLRSSEDGVAVTTGHAGGVITVDTAEAQPWVREENRVQLGESYRTPLGHVRHELGHWWWATAVGDVLDVDDVRDRFGDERADYSEALDRHYASGDDGSWRPSFVSFYAASHPWEDFAESFAHVLHMQDTYETAAANGIVPPADLRDFAGLASQWTDLTLTINELNRSMGMRDPYPFVVAEPALDKMGFVAASLVAV